MQVELVILVKPQEDLMVEVDVAYIMAAVVGLI
jgi:hypothetical protein